MSGNGALTLSYGVVLNQVFDTNKIIIIVIIIVIIIIFIIIIIIIIIIIN